MADILTAGEKKLFLKVASKLLGNGLEVTFPNSITEVNSGSILTELVGIHNSAQNLMPALFANATHWNPIDFTATYNSANSLLLSGHETIENPAQIRSVKVIKENNTSELYINGINATMTYSGNIITVYGLLNDFSSNDAFEVGINFQKKGYDYSLDLIKVQEQSPLWYRYTEKENLVTNQELTTTIEKIGSKIDMRGYSSLIVAVTMDINDSQNAVLRVLGELEGDGSLDARIDGISARTLWTTSELSSDGTVMYAFKTDGIPFLQLSAGVESLGNIPGRVTIDIIKKY